MGGDDEAEAGDVELGDRDADEGGLPEDVHADASTTTVTAASLNLNLFIVLSLFGSRGGEDRPASA